MQGGISIVSVILSKTKKIFYFIIADLQVLQTILFQNCRKHNNQISQGKFGEIFNLFF